MDAGRLTRATTIQIDVESAGKGVQATIRKLKVGEEDTINDACTDREAETYDAGKAAKMIVQACLVDPPLSIDEVDQMDIEVFMEVSEKISIHSGLLAAAGSEVSEATAGFPDTDAGADPDGAAVEAEGEADPDGQESRDTAPPA